MSSNIGYITSIASQQGHNSLASHIYLWTLSRIDMNKFVQRSIISRKTIEPVKMVITEFNRRDHYHGTSILAAIHRFSVCQMLSRVFEGTYVYTRRKPTLNGQSPDIYQIVMMWNCPNKQYVHTFSYHESLMLDAYRKEEDRREQHRILNDPDYWEEMREELRERIADENQTRAMNGRNDICSGLVSPVSFE